MADADIALLDTSQVEIQLLSRAVFGQLGGALPSQALAQFASAARRIYFREGTVIYRQGEPTEHIYFLIEGRVSLDSEGLKSWVLGDGSAFGILDATIERPHDRTAVALQDTTALAVAVDDWLDMVEDNLELTQGTIVRNASRLWEDALQLSPTGGFPKPDEAPSLATAMGGDVSHDAASMDPFEKLLGLRLAPLFQRAGMQALIRLARLARARTLQEGELLFEQGAEAGSLYIVLLGGVEIERDAPPIRAAFGPTSVVGSYAGLCLDKRPFRARATKRTALLEVDHDDLYELMEDHFDLVRSVQSYVSLERDRLQRLHAPRAATTAARRSSLAPPLR